MISSVDTHTHTFLTSIHFFRDIQSIEPSYPNKLVQCPKITSDSQLIKTTQRRYIYYLASSISLVCLFLMKVLCQQHVVQRQQKKVWECQTVSSSLELLAAAASVVSVTKCHHSTRCGGRAMSRSPSRLGFGGTDAFLPSCEDTDSIAGLLICTEQKRGGREGGGKKKGGVGEMKKMSFPV